MPLAVGSVVRDAQGAYRVLDHLDSGGSAEVWLAENVDGETVVVKQFARATFSATPEMAQRAIREIELLHGLRHPNIVSLLDYAIDSDDILMVLEHLEGGTLRKYVDLFGAMDVLQSGRVMDQVLQALIAIHEQGIVHRDVTPKNVIIGRAGCVKLIDFGLAHIQSPERLTAHRDHIGSLLYLSPEQFRDPRSVGSAADIYSAGQLWLELATGGPPLGPGSSGRSVQREPLLGLIGQMRSYEIDQRPSAEVALRKLRDEILALAGLRPAWFQRELDIESPKRRVLARWQRSVSPPKDSSLGAAKRALEAEMKPWALHYFNLGALRSLLDRVASGEFEPSTRARRAAFLAELYLISDRPSTNPFEDGWGLPREDSVLYDALKVCDSAELRELAVAFGHGAIEFWAKSTDAIAEGALEILVTGRALDRGQLTSFGSIADRLMCLECEEEIEWRSLPHPYEYWSAFQCKCLHSGAVALDGLKDLVRIRAEEFLPTHAVRELAMNGVGEHWDSLKSDRGLLRDWDRRLQLCRDAASDNYRRTVRPPSEVVEVRDEPGSS
jgi:serine/threonine protein kinase